MVKWKRKKKVKRKKKIKWGEYSKQLVQRGRNTANFINELKKMQETWDEELKEMNKGKRGKPYKYANSLIILLEIFKLLTMKGYRFTQGFAYLFLSVVPTYSAIQKRVVKFDLEILAQMNKKTLKAIGKDKVIRIIKDGTGIQINGRYVWIDKRFNRKRKRKWKKLDITIDTKQLAILSLRVLPEAGNEGEAEEFRKTIDEAKNNLPKGTRIGACYGDGAFDSVPNFEYCDSNGIEPVIRIRKPTRKKVERRKKINDRLILHGKAPIKGDTRDKYAEEQVDWNGFVKRKKYGKRGGIEGFNGSFKGFYGERAYSKLDPNIENEFSFKTILWNKMILGGKL